MSGTILLLLTPLRQALERIDRKARPLLATPELLNTEEGEDLLDVICMQFTAAGEAIKRIDKLKPGWLVESCPQIDWKGAMGFRDVIFPGSYRSFERQDQRGRLLYGSNRNA